MHDRLFNNQRELTRPDLSEHPEAIGLDVAALDRCVDSGQSAARIRKDVAEARRLQTTGTPTFFVGPPGRDPPRVIRAAVRRAHPPGVLRPTRRSESAAGPPEDQTTGW